MFLIVSSALVACGGGGGNASNTSSSSTSSSSTSSSSSSSLSTPQNLSVVAANSGSAFILEWDAVSEATGYNVYYATEANIDPLNISVFANSGTAFTSDTAHSVEGLMNGTTYFAVVTAVKDDTEESGASGEIRILVQEHIEGYSYWPTDTGVDFCAADTSGLDCPIAEYPRQDGDYQGVLPTYVKVSDSGATLTDSATEWACVQDQNSGLLWEVKVDDVDSLHHYSHTFTWYQPSNNGGDAGATDSHLSNCLWEECNTNALIEAVNNEELCGYSDWRLPTSQELMSLSINRSAQNPVVNTTYFPYANESYWTAMTRSSDNAQAWYVQHRHNNARVWRNKTDVRAVRLVRGEIETTTGETSCANHNASLAPTTPTDGFALNDDGTLIHRKTGLMWMRCSVGQTWNQAEQACDGTSTLQQWQDALQAAADSEHAGHTDWRLPDLHELDTIVELSCWNPSINTTAFPNTYQPTDALSSGGYWASTPTQSQPGLESGLGWVVNFETGRVNAYFRDSASFIMAARLVRTPTAAPAL